MHHYTPINIKINMWALDSGDDPNLGLFVFNCAVIWISRIFSPLKLFKGGYFNQFKWGSFKWYLFFLLGMSFSHYLLYVKEWWKEEKYLGCERQLINRLAGHRCGGSAAWQALGKPKCWVPWEQHKYVVIWSDVLANQNRMVAPTKPGPLWFGRI